MRIIKPYGRTHVAPGETEDRKRVLRLNDEAKTIREVHEFAQSQDELIIAQWISAIDKIATKPSKGGATKTQRALRDRIGKACWALLMEKGLLPGSADPDTKAHVEKLWNFKVAPYGNQNYRERRGKPEPNAKGRWYERFTGDCEPAKADAAAIARRIHEHLYEAEYRLKPDAPKKRRGRIEARARSITSNVLRPASTPEGGEDWGEAEWEIYRHTGNVAEEIKLAARAREEGKDSAGTRRVTASISAIVLSKHYALLFRCKDGTPQSIQQAKETSPRLFSLHKAVKDTYSRILKHHKKGQNQPKGRRRTVSDILPGNMQQLRHLVEKKARNRDLNALVREGKVIHYEAARTDERDSTKDIIDGWPADITGSVYWTSDGQAQIKRNEAFVRIWRHVLTLAACTLKDWADPSNSIPEDILLAGGIRKATGDAFRIERQHRKLDLLFGNRAAIFKSAGDDETQKEILKWALTGIASLRHSAFHFKGLGSFHAALTEAKLPATGAVSDAVQALWRADTEEKAAQKAKTLHGAHVDFFLSEPQARTLFREVLEAGTSPLPLPRFARVLRRSSNLPKEKDDGPMLPERPNRADLEDPARLCQYAALKLLYEAPFRHWLDTRDTQTLRDFIARSVDRATKGAQDLNHSDIIVSRADALRNLGDGETIEEFFFKLSASTAGEMRVQRGYESDPERAREQAGYIEKLKWDVIALAFSAYLNEKGFGFLLELAPGTPQPAQPLFDFERLPVPAAAIPAGDWQGWLYFLLHLVPVEEVSKLLNQVRKWDILAREADETEAERSRETAAGLARGFELYLDMHDAKFAGGMTLTGCNDFRKFFSPEDAFNAAFPLHPGEGEDQHLPLRGLREIMRFGHLPALQAVFEKHRVTADEVNRWTSRKEGADRKPGIADWQKRREELHEEWTRNKRLSGDPLREYVDVLQKISAHRHLAAQVTLTNHVRLHRLLMTVLGRLVDYSGLWERDLYFATLALMHREGHQPDMVFTGEGRKALRNGQIVHALRNTLTGGGIDIRCRLKEYFSDYDKGKGSPVGIRNDFAHFDMLSADHLPVDLTACVNAARDLMAYDRKLKNAVSRSIIEALNREGLELAWTMDGNHRLNNAAIRPKQALHLGGLCLVRKGARQPNRKEDKYKICEDLHGREFVEMAASLFGSQAKRHESVADLNFDRIDF